MNRPNILFAFADDWGRYASAYRKHYGGLNRFLSTPTFDRVASEGVLFTNALVPAPSCTPCRSSVLSGRYFWNTGLGAILQGARWDAEIPSYPLMLEEAGYHIGFTYKVWFPGTPRDAPYGAEHHRYEPAGDNFNSFSHVAVARAKAASVESAKRSLLAEVRDNFDAFLADRPDDTPFCYWWGPTNTHRSWERGSGKALWGIEPDDLRGSLPEFLPDVPEVREDVADYLGEAMAFDAGVGVLLERLEAAGELDNTLVVISGDHGVPGLPRGKCNLYDIGLEVALAARWPASIPGGRSVTDLVNIMDLCPTFLDAAGVAPDEHMSGRSLMPILSSGKEGQVEAGRTSVVTGRERHVASAREGFLPYPQRAIRTHDYLYIRNFAPERWPMGDPKGLDNPETVPPPYEDLAADTMIAYADLDASPTKAWMIHHRGEAAYREMYELGFGKRPSEELYDVRNDPWHMNNLAAEPAHEATKQMLSEELEGVLRAEGDPRVAEEPCRYEHAPYAGPLEP